MKVAVVMLAASISKDKIEMTQEAIDSIHQNKGEHNVNLVVVESHSLHKYNGATIVTKQGEFNYNQSLKTGLKLFNLATFDYVFICNNDILVEPNCFDELINTGIDSTSPKDPTLEIHDPYKGITFGYRTSYLVCGWALMVKASVIGKIGIDTLFPDPLSFWYQDNFYAYVLQKNNIKHALIASAHCIHLESQSHGLVQDIEKHTNQLQPIYDELCRQYDLRFSQTRHGEIFTS